MGSAGLALTVCLVFVFGLGSAVGAAQPPNLTGTWTPTTGGAWLLSASGPGLTHLHAEWAGIGAHADLRGSFDGTLNSAGNAFTGSFSVVEGSTQVSGTMTFTIDSPTQLTVTLTANGGGSSTIVMTRSGGGSSSPAATMSGITGKVEVQVDGGAWQPAGPTTELKPGDRVHTGYKGSAKLALPDGSTITLAPMSLLVVEQIQTENLGSKTRLRVIVGLTGGQLEEIVKKVGASAVAASDFEVRTPTTTTSSRGTVFTNFYDPGTKAVVIGTISDSVAVTPSRHGSKTIVVPAGKEVELTPAGASPLAPLGKADAHGGIDRARAYQLAATAVAKAATTCGLGAPTGTIGFSVKPAAAGWVVTLNVAGKVNGASTWSVAQTKATPLNALAKRIAGGCGG